MSQELYLPTHIHGSVFIIGMILGVYFDEIRDWLRESAVSWFRWRKTKFKFQKLFQIRRVLISTVVLTPVLAFYAQLLFLKDDSSPKLQAFFMSSVHNVSGVFFAWLILIFESGTFDWFDKFVSHKMWKPMGKLTFCIYLVHPCILIGYVLKHTEMIDYNAVYIVRFKKTLKSSDVFTNWHFRSACSLQFFWPPSFLLLLCIFWSKNHSSNLENLFQIHSALWRVD